MTTIVIDEQKYEDAVVFAQKHNISIYQLVDNFLLSFQRGENVRQMRREIPNRIMALRGALKDIVPDPSDERMMYILNKGNETSVS